MKEYRYCWVVVGVLTVLAGVAEARSQSDRGAMPGEDSATNLFIDLRSATYAGGARCNGQVIDDGIVEVGSRLLSTTRARFVRADVGDDIAINRAGEDGGTLITRIAAFNSPKSITLKTAAAATVRSAVVHWGADDTAAIQSALNQWRRGGTLISPSGRTCMFAMPLTVTFTPGAWNNTKVINFNGGAWFGMVGGDHDLRFETKGRGEITAYNIKLEDGVIEDAGRATFAVLDFNGGGGSDHYMAEIEGEPGLKVVSNGSAHAIHLQSVFQSRFFGVTAANNRGQVVGAFDWYVQKGNEGDQLTGDIALVGCEGINGDIAVYDQSSEVKLFGGTYFQTLHQLFYGSGVSGVVINGAHFENSWVGSRASADVRPDVECDGTCEIQGNVDYSAGGQSGGRNYFARLYVSGPYTESTLGYTTMGGGRPFRQAFVQTGSGWRNPDSGHITLTGIGLPEVTDGNGICEPLGFCSNLTLIGSDGAISTSSIKAVTITAGVTSSSHAIKPDCSLGMFGDAQADLNFYTVGLATVLTVIVDDRANGSCGGAILVQVPFTSRSYVAFVCRASPSGVTGSGAISEGSHVINIVKYDGTSLASTGAKIICSGLIKSN